MKNKHLLLILIFSTLLDGYLLSLILPIIFIMMLPTIRKFNVIKRIPYEIRRIIYIYVLLIIVSSVSFIVHYTSIYNFAIYLIMNSTFVLFPLIIFNKENNNRVYRNINLFYKFQLLIILLQIIFFAINNKTINIFGGRMDAGDYFKGSFQNSTLTCIFFSICIFIFVNEYYKTRNIRIMYKIIISCLVVIITSANANIVILILSVLIASLINLILIGKIKQIFILVFSIVLAFKVYSIIQPDNLIYIKSFINKSLMVDFNDKPRKIQYIKESLIDFPKESWEIPIIGIGGGNYSSRSAMIVSNEYLSQDIITFPNKCVNEYNKKYVISKWNKDILSQSYSDGIANQPFSSIITIFGESGLIGLIIIITVLAMIYRLEISRLDNKNAIKGGFSIFLALSLLLDNYIEYSSIVAIIWIALYYIVIQSRIGIKN